MFASELSGYILIIDCDNSGYCLILIRETTPAVSVTFWAWGLLSCSVDCVSTPSVLRRYCDASATLLRLYCDATATLLRTTANYCVTTAP
jgi:hypothetical protein